MKINIPSNVRVALYIFTAVGTPIIGYLLDKDIIGMYEASLWSAEVGVVSAMAAFNVNEEDGNDT